MVSRAFRVLAALVVASVTMFAVTEDIAHADGDSLPSVGVEVPPRECMVKLPGSLGRVLIQAGPRGNSGLAENFPELENDCPVEVSEGQCLKWTYRWKFPGGITPLEAITSIDTDITIFASDPPGATVSKIFPITAEGERFLKFDATAQTFTASYWTPPGVGPGTLTAGFVAKKGFFPLVGRCALAGADDRIIIPNLAVTTQTVDQVGSCSITRTLDAQGCTVKIHVPNECNATVENANLTIDNEASIAIGCDTKITAEGSRRYCYPTSFGGITCVTLP